MLHGFVASKPSSQRKGDISDDLFASSPTPMQQQIVDMYSQGQTYPVLSPQSSFSSADPLSSPQVSGRTGMIFGMSGNVANMALANTAPSSLFASPHLASFGGGTIPSNFSQARVSDNNGIMQMLSGLEHKMMNGMEHLNTGTSITQSDVSITHTTFDLQRQDFPNITYWTEDEWNTRQGKGVTLLCGKSDYSTSAKCNFIQTADGKSPTEAEWKGMHNAARAAFNGLESAPDSWMANSSTKQRLAVYDTLIGSFPFLGYCNGYWKVEKYVVNQYPLWKKARKDKFETETIQTRNRTQVVAARKRAIEGTSDGDSRKRTRGAGSTEVAVFNPLAGMTALAIPSVGTVAASPAEADTIMAMDTAAQSIIAPPIVMVLPATPDVDIGVPAVLLPTLSSDPAATNGKGHPQSPAPPTPPDVQTAVVPAPGPAPLVVPTTSSESENRLAALPSTTPEAQTTVLPTPGAAQSVPKRKSQLFKPGPKSTARYVFPCTILTNADYCT
ncbi:hypothetical protein PHLCEN_2v10254 [Hermanssonia centrifuga]|uniref:Uncharacterized protein n=1 Tax=Hermanssonia centrifuga TaxID=98765 RepID=A0A2R6NP94_9APHY|nr:hypothetical protein PHLCEN_2v10254 [Hermanssonia centrifuga]